jgi:hypothetical protein
MATPLPSETPADNVGMVPAMTDDPAAPILEHLSVPT